MNVYYKYAPDGYKLSVLSYGDDCVYWYNMRKYESIFWICSERYPM